MATINVNSKSFNNLVAQLGHFGWGGLLPLAFYVHSHLWWGLAAVFCWAIPKEFLFDKYVEGQAFSDNFLDFLMYAAGLLGALIVIYWR